MEPREEELSPEAAAAENVIDSNAVERVAAGGAFKYLYEVTCGKVKAAEAQGRLGVEITGPNLAHLTFMTRVPRSRNRLVNMNDYHMEDSAFLMLDLQQQYKHELAAAASAAGGGGEGKLPCPACARFTALSKGPQYARLRKMGSPGG